MPGSPPARTRYRMHAIIDLLPLIAFFVAYWLSDFQTAMVVIMIAMSIQVIATRLITGTVSKMLLISAGLVVGLGSISLLLQNDLIFKWKPTVLNWLFAAICLGSQYIGSKPVVQRILETASKEDIRLSRAHWHQLNLMWVAFFVLSGIANIIVAYRFSEAVWVNFKLFGLLGMTIVFIMLQTIWLNQRMIPGPTEPDTDN